MPRGATPEQSLLHSLVAFDRSGTLTASTVFGYPEDSLNSRVGKQLPATLNAGEQLLQGRNLLVG